MGRSTVSSFEEWRVILAKSLLWRQPTFSQALCRVTKSAKILLTVLKEDKEELEDEEELEDNETILDYC